MPNNRNVWTDAEKGKTNNFRIYVISYRKSEVMEDVSVRWFLH